MGFEKEKEKKTKQLTIIKSFGKVKKYDKTDSKWISLDNKFTQMMVLDDLPLTHVEDLGFQWFDGRNFTTVCTKAKDILRGPIARKMYSLSESKIESTVSSLIKKALDHLQLMNGLTAPLEFLLYSSHIMQSIKFFRGSTLNWMLNLFLNTMQATILKMYLKRYWENARFH